MNESEARELVEKCKHENPGYSLPMRMKSEGYLEAIDKVTGIEMLAKGAPCLCDKKPNELCPRCLILKKWEAEK